MIEHDSIAYKTQTPSIVHIKAVELLNRHAAKSSGGVISFSEVRKVLGWLYHFDRRESNQLIYEMQVAGLVRLVAYHGIVLEPRGE